MNKVVWLVATAMLGVGGFAMAAHANSLEPTPREISSMEHVVVAEPQRSVVLNQLADEIRGRIGTSDDNITTVDEAIQLPMLDGLLDEDGELNLPLGLTVYNTMGDTSIGFGTEF
jgi:hypothetical protein